MYGFLSGMWVMRKIDEQYLDIMVAKKFITSDEKNIILATPQVDSH